MLGNQLLIMSPEPKHGTVLSRVRSAFLQILRENEHRLFTLVFMTAILYGRKYEIRQMPLPGEY